MQVLGQVFKPHNVSKHDPSRVEWEPADPVRLSSARPKPSMKAKDYSTPKTHQAFVFYLSSSIQWVSMAGNTSVRLFHPLALWTNKKKKTKKVTHKTGLMCFGHFAWLWLRVHDKAMSNWLKCLSVWSQFIAVHSSFFSVWNSRWVSHQLNMNIENLQSVYFSTHSILTLSSQIDWSSWYKIENPFNVFFPQLRRKENHWFDRYFSAQKLRDYYAEQIGFAGLLRIVRQEILTQKTWRGKKVIYPNGR